MPDTRMTHGDHTGAGTPRVTRLTATPDLLGESPVWDPEAQCLWWIDGVAGKVRRMRVTGNTPAEAESFSFDGHVGSIALADEGCLIVALDHEVLLFSPDEPVRLVLLRLEEADPRMRLNDGKTDRHGRFLVAGMGRGGEAIGALHRICHNRDHAILHDGLTVGNGICFSPDGRVLYFTDTPARKVLACDYDPVTGATSKLRVHIDTAELGSGVDGATVDREGNLWAALIRTARIGCFDPSGRLLRSIAAPTDLPSSLAFGGPAMDRLFVTSIRDSGTGRAVSQHPLGGHLFVIDGLGATGIPETRFGQI